MSVPITCRSCAYKRRCLGLTVPMAPESNYAISKVGLKRVLSVQRQPIQWQMPMPRSCSRSSTFRSDSGYFKYIITTSRITSVEGSNQRNGSSGFFLRAMAPGSGYFLPRV